MAHHLRGLRFQLLKRGHGGYGILAPRAGSRFCCYRLEQFDIDTTINTDHDNAYNIQDHTLNSWSSLVLVPQLRFQPVSCRSNPVLRSSHITSQVLNMEEHLGWFNYINYVNLMYGSTTFGTIINVLGPKKSPLFRSISTLLTIQGVRLLYGLPNSNAVLWGQVTWVVRVKFKIQTISK